MSEGLGPTRISYNVRIDVCIHTYIQIYIYICTYDVYILGDIRSMPTTNNESAERKMYNCTAVATVGRNDLAEDEKTGIRIVRMLPD